MRMKRSPLLAVLLVMLSVTAVYAWTVHSAYVWQIKYTVLKTECSCEMANINIGDILGGETKEVTAEPVTVGVTTIAPLVFSFNISDMSDTAGLESWQVKIYHTSVEDANLIGTITSTDPSAVVSTELSGLASYTFLCTANVTAVPYLEEATTGSLIVVLTVTTP